MNGTPDITSQFDGRYLGPVGPASRRSHLNRRLNGGFLQSESRPFFSARPLLWPSPARRGTMTGGAHRISCEVSRERSEPARTFLGFYQRVGYSVCLQRLVVCPWQECPTQACYPSLVHGACPCAVCLICVADKPRTLGFGVCGSSVWSDSLPALPLHEVLRFLWRNVLQP